MSKERAEEILNNRASRYNIEGIQLYTEEGILKAMEQYADERISELKADQSKVAIDVIEKLKAIKEKQKHPTKYKEVEIDLLNLLNDIE